MPTKIDYKAIYTPLIEVLKMEGLSVEQRNEAAIKIMEKTLSERESAGQARNDGEG